MSGYSMDFVLTVEHAEKYGRGSIAVDAVLIRETIETRDELLAALKKVAARLDVVGTGPIDLDLVMGAAALIAKTEGKS